MGAIMLLKQFCDFAKQQEAKVPPPMFENRRIRWIVPLRSDGSFLGALESTCGNGRNPSSGKHFWAPYEYRASACNPRLLADTAEFVLGLVPQGREPQISTDRHAAFIDQVERCAAATGSATVRAIESFLRTWDARNWRLPEELSATHEVTFRVEETYPIQDPEIILYWNTVCMATNHESSFRVCSICGLKTQSAKMRHFKIRNLVGGRTSGLSLVSSSVPSAESYGLESSNGVPTCSRCEEAMCRAANYLISNPHSRIVCGSCTYIFWADKHREFDFKSLLIQPDPSEVRILEQAAFSGDGSVDRFDESPFNVAGLNANSARVVVRDWMGTSLRELKKHLSRFFTLQQIVGSDGKSGKPMGLLGLVAGFESRHGQLILQALMRLAVEGGALPIFPLVAAIRKNSIENAVTRNRAAIIKMVMLSQIQGSVEDSMTGLDSGNEQPGYLCGRLLALFQTIQWTAQSNINASVVDRFFAMASVAPRIVFPRLFRLSQAHLRKVHERRPAAYFALQNQLEEVIQKLPEFPAVLSMFEQGLFALGYYHQRAFDRHRAASRSASNRLPHNKVESEPADV